MADALRVHLGDRSYSIFIRSGLLSDKAAWQALIQDRPFCMVSNDKLSLYLTALCKTLGAEPSGQIVLPDGERYKNLDSLKVIFQHLTQRHFPRSGVLIALGGGVIGDVTGFAAATYQRGINFIQVPTTLLAMVDSSVGGKTAVNFEDAKNHIGAFHQPIAVLSDLNTLKTLPDREYAAGLAEVLKHGFIWDKAFFEWLMTHSQELKARDPVALEKAIRRSCEIKATIVEQDEFETHLRMFLNFGHTFGHAIEAYSHYQDFKHGEAVAIGMLFALEKSIAHGMQGHEGLISRVKDWYKIVGLPTELPAHYDQDRLMEIMRHDKKKTAKGGLRFVLLSEVGKAYIHHE